MEEDAHGFVFAKVTEQCYFEPTAMNISVALVLMLGTIISYVPQYVAIIKAKSSEGLSFLMMAIGLTGGFLIAVNSGVLKWSYAICCLDLNTLGCLKNNLATEQLLASLGCVLVLYILYIKYHPMEPTAKISYEKRKKQKKISIIVLIVVAVLSVIISVICGILYYNIELRNGTVKTIGQVLGVAAAISMVIQWTPQIYTTFVNKSQGNLSILMLLLQMPGALLVMFFQAILNKSDISTWLPYAFLFVEQFILVTLCVYFNFQEKKRKSKNNEKQRLLGEIESVEEEN
jgi:cystinosin